MIFIYNPRILYEEKKILYSILPNRFVLNLAVRAKEKRQYQNKLDIASYLLSG